MSPANATGLARFRMLPPSAVPVSAGDLLAAASTLFRGTMQKQDARVLLDEAVRHAFGVRHCRLHASGRAALASAFRAMRSLAPERDEVLLPAYTSYSVPAAAVNAGLRVRLYDLAPDTLAPDMASMAEAMSERTLCAVVCHLFGYPVPLDGARALCRQHGAWLLDDAAQAMGARINGRWAGTCGDVGLFSLSRGKNITAVDGGILVTDDAVLGARLAQDAPYACHTSPADAQLQASQPKASFRAEDAKLVLKALALWVCQAPRAYWLPAALPFLHVGASRFNPDFAADGLRPLQAVLATRLLSRLKGINAERGAVARAVSRRLRDVRTVRPVAGAEPVYLRLPVLPMEGQWPDNRVPACPRLGVVRSYPQALQDLEPLGPYLNRGGIQPVSRWLAANLLTLPTHVYVDGCDMIAIQDALVKEVAVLPQEVVA